MKKALAISTWNASVFRHLARMSWRSPGDHQATIKNRNDDNQFCMFCKHLRTMSGGRPGDHQATIKNQNDDNQFYIFVAPEGLTRVKCETLNFGQDNDKEATIHNAGNRNE